MLRQRPAFFHFGILNAAVAISGFTQGMLLPVIAIIFERDGMSSSLNGIHAASLYIGMLLAIPFLEVPLRRYGFKPFIITGGLIVFLTLISFSLWKSVWFWFFLRIAIGIGNNILHFGTQTWVTFLSSAQNRGRNISLYGLAFGLGYGFGPMTTRMLEISETMPFMLAAGLSFIVWLTLFLLKNEFPDDGNIAVRSSPLAMFARFKQVWKYAWVAFLLPFGYGFLEASISGNFPVYALRTGIEVSAVAILLPAFAIGSIVFQLPLGILSDRLGRKNILMFVTIAGFFIFIAAGIFETSVLILVICFFIAGMLVGSTYSLGLAYMVDLVPRNLLPAGNLMASILFSIGSITGPFIGGLTIQYMQNFSFLFTIGFMLLSIFVTLILFKPKNEEAFQQSSINR